MSARVTPAHHLGHQGQQCEDLDLHDRCRRNLSIALSNDLLAGFKIYDDPEGKCVTAPMRCGCVFVAFGMIA